MNSEQLFWTSELTSHHTEVRGAMSISKRIFWRWCMIVELLMGWFPVLSLEEGANLSVHFSLKEIAVVVATSDGNNWPGLDGFNIWIFKRFWDIIKREVGGMFHHYFLSMLAFRDFSRLFSLPLFLRWHSPLEMGTLARFLLGSLCKLNSKVLAGILALVMDTIILPYQPSLIKVRELPDWVVAVNDIINLAHNSKKECPTILGRWWVEVEFFVEETYVHLDV